MEILTASRKTGHFFSLYLVCVIITMNYENHGVLHCFALICTPSECYSPVISTAIMLGQGYIQQCQ